MVGRLIEQQQFGLIEQQPAQRDAAALAAGKLGHVGVVGRAAQRVHRQIDLGIELPQVLGVDLVLELGHLLRGLVGVVGGDLVVAVEQRLLRRHALHHVLAHRKLRIELRLLFEIADPRPFGDPALADETPCRCPP
jgi:hypothetical protein